MSSSEDDKKKKKKKKKDKKDQPKKLTEDEQNQKDFEQLGLEEKISLTKLQIIERTYTTYYLAPKWVILIKGNLERICINSGISRGFHRNCMYF
jgi:hypothetical protein